MGKPAETVPSTSSSVQMSVAPREAEVVDIQGVSSPLQLLNLRKLENMASAAYKLPKYKRRRRSSCSATFPKVGFISTASPAWAKSCSSA